MAEARIGTAICTNCGHVISCQVGRDTATCPKCDTTMKLTWVPSDVEEHPELYTQDEPDEE